MPRYEETEVTAVQLAVILSRGAFESGFMGSEGVASLVDRVMSADPRISDSLKFRTEMLAFCYLPLDIVLVGHHPADAVRVRGAALVFMAGALKAGVDSPQQFDWDEVPEFIANRLKSYAEILDQPSLGPGPPPSRP